MIDPLAEIVTLLQPSAALSKVASARGPWRVRRSEAGRPFYCAILEGSCRLAVQGYAPIILRAGDFVLVPDMHEFEISSLAPPPAGYVELTPARLETGEMRHGEANGPPDILMLVGYCDFAAADADLLVSLLPRFAHVRGETRLTTLVQLVGDEYRARRPARDVILTRLLEVLLIEALRATNDSEPSPGLLRGLADDRLAAAIRKMHESPSENWTVDQLAKEAALSRSVFFERFRRAVGVAPIEYLLAWRMAQAKALLRQGASISETAQHVGYSSASTFSVAFTRHVGTPPASFARGNGDAPAMPPPAVQ